MSSHNFPPLGSPPDRSQIASDWLKGGLSFFGGLIWAGITRWLVPDSPVGVAIVLVPCGALVLVGAFFILRARLKNLV